MASGGELVKIFGVLKTFTAWKTRGGLPDFYREGVGSIGLPDAGGKIEEPGRVGPLLIIEPGLVGVPIDIGKCCPAGPKERVHCRIPKPDAGVRSSERMEPAKGVEVNPGGIVGVE